MSLLASGVYRYWHDGELQEIVEPWSLRQAPQGLLLAGTRQVAGATLLDIEADYDGPLCTGLRLRWQPPEPAAARDVHYRHEGIRLSWRFADEPSAQSRRLPVGYLLFPLLRAATGPLLTTLSAEAQPVVLPSLREAGDGPGFLRPLLSERRALPGTPAYGGLRHYRYYGGEYREAGCDCWLDEHGLMRRYRWDSPSGQWDVRLDELVLACGFRGFAR